MFLAKVASFVFLVTLIHCDNSTPNVKVENGPPHYQPMTQLITLMNKLQDVIKATDDTTLDLPTIAVVGVESSGKSSVLESFVRRNFLPRGEGIVTRCPIVLRLVHTPLTDVNKNGGYTEWCEFDHKPDKKWTDYTKVKEEIELRTRELTGGSKGISFTPITLTVYSPNVVTLTVVDLPGIVKNARHGQPDDIEDQTLKLIRSYISKESTIILAVSAANNEITTSESIKLAREVDPTGERTLAVVTKLDLAVGNNMVEVLTGDVLRLKHGFVGVINQSEDDIVKGLTMDEIRENEAKLIRKKFPSLASKNGSKYLAERLSRLLVAHILKQLPGIENKINEDTKETEELLTELGSDDTPHKAKTMSKTIITFAKRFSSEFEGIGRNVRTGSITAGARVKTILYEHFVAELEAIDALETITDDQITIAIVNSGAMESDLTICEVAYKDLVKAQIKRLLGPSSACVKSVHEEMQGAVQNSLDPNITFQFPRLSETIVAVVTKFLSDRLDEVNKCLEKFINIESSFVRTSRVDFQKAMKELLESPDITEPDFGKKLVQTLGSTEWVEKTTAFSQYPTIAKENEEKDEFDEFDREIEEGTSDEDPGSNPNYKRNKISTSQDHDNIYIVKELIRKYFEITRETLKDYLPKLLAYDMIYFSADNLDAFLNDELHKEGKIDDLIQASPDAQAKREEAQNKLLRLKVATKTIAEAREFR